MIFAIIAWFIIGCIVWMVFSLNMGGFNTSEDIDFICVTAVLFCWLWPVWLLAMILKIVVKKIVERLGI